MKRMMLLILAFAAMLAAGCQAVEIGVMTGRSGASIEVTVSEEELNAALAESVANTESDVSVVPAIAFGNGTITLSATVMDADGTSAAGSITFIVAEEDNKLRIYTTSVSLTGTDSNGNEALNLQVSTNREIAAAMAEQTGPTFDSVEGAVFVQSIEIVPGEMTITIRLPG